MKTASVHLFGSRIAAITWMAARECAVFEYDMEFLRSGIEVAPLMMPAAQQRYEFPQLPHDTFKGLPGMLADCLPDRFGNKLIDQWLALQGRSAASFHPVERLCYLGSRAMGALEFVPSEGESDSDEKIEIHALVELANEVLSERKNIRVSLRKADAMAGILRVGTSAGGARAKAVVAWNRVTGEMRSGQVDLPPGFSAWLLKFDGVSANRDKELADPLGFGRIEYAYYLMAVAAGIEMNDCELLEENGRAHFLTRRFDRPDGGGKLHMQSLCALAHYDFNQAGAYSYEQAFQVGRRLALSQQELEQLYRRAVFNVIARNQDDHTKNIAFLMGRSGDWRLAPAFDVTYAYNPDGAWTSQHQMSLSGKRDEFLRSDLLTAASFADIKNRRALEILEEVFAAVKRWKLFAQKAGIAAPMIESIRKALRVTMK
jgi:serine/threonine-protein kinase HipA